MKPKYGFLSPKERARRAKVSAIRKRAGRPGLDLDHEDSVVDLDLLTAEHSYGKISSEASSSRSSRSRSSTSDKAPAFVFQGARVVELQSISDGLRTCNHCGAGPLSLQNTVSETHLGLGGWIYVKCMATGCGAVCPVPLSSQHGNQAWNLNTRLALGMQRVTLTPCMHEHSH